MTQPKKTSFSGLGRGLSALLGEVESEVLAAGGDPLIAEDGDLLDLGALAAALAELQDLHHPRTGSAVTWESADGPKEESEVIAAAVVGLRWKVRRGAKPNSIAVVTRLQREVCSGRSSTHYPQQLTNPHRRGYPEFELG